ncbi:hypothetical protein H6P81_015796 [Aristolochia fimbriata]|uniref:Zinc-finger domain-containing protein n=1 Tax=Aristolochia fimbriata TaxID=158543 RepID=A0AAV7E7T1_ARIFI|nr:hypothetical protein H6P81_015796 [Aristolochia fimbriata]
MGALTTEVDYEARRRARISENQARLASLGIDKSLEDLKSMSSAAKATKIPPRKYQKVVYDFSSLRRSGRLKGKSPQIEDKTGGSERTQTRSRRERDRTEQRPANAPVLTVRNPQLRLSSAVLARRCHSKERGSVYDVVLGICCHFCRQKKLCGEEDCKRCGEGDFEQPCIGKTDCSICHSSNGVLCRACLKVRYGEDMDEVRKDKGWMCPHCIEEKGTKPYWICNSSLCLKKRKIQPTGIAIYEARKNGFKSVAHRLMEQLKQAANER